MIKWKKWQKWIQKSYPNHVHFCRPGRKHVQSFKIVWEVAITRYPLSIYLRSVNDKVKQLQKKWQKIRQGLYKKHMHIFRLWRKYVQSSKMISIQLYKGVVLTRYPLFIYWGWKMPKFTMWKKVKKHNLTITSKPHAHPHTMKKTHAKFHNNRYKTVRGVALTRGTNCLYIIGEKWLSSQCGKSNKKWSNNYIQTTCISSYHEENICKVSKRSVQNC